MLARIGLRGGDDIKQSQSRKQPICFFPLASSSVTRDVANDDLSPSASFISR